MTERTFYDEAKLRAFAAEFARSLQPGDIVGLSGPLGSGKTTFVKGAVAGRFGDDPVSSPSFTFWHRYVPGNSADATPIDHLDFYRIEDPRELDELGLDEAFGGRSIVFAEWWRNGEAVLPKPHYEIEIEGKGGDPRIVRISRA